MCYLEIQHCWISLRIVYLNLLVLFYEYRFSPNVTVVDDANQVCISEPQQGLESMQNSTEESNEPDYDEDRDQLEEEQEEESDEITPVTTTNEVF